MGAANCRYRGCGIRKVPLLRDSGILSLSINLAGSVPPLGDEVSLRLAAQIASATDAGAALSDLDSGGSGGLSESNRGGTPGQVPPQAGQPGLPALIAQLNAARASHGMDSLGMPPEDWFESSLPAEHASGATASESAASAQLIRGSLIHADLRALDGGLGAGAIVPGQALSNYGVDSRTLPLQLLTAAATAETVTAKAAQGWHRPERSDLRLDDQLMREIPLLFAPVPAEPQLGSLGVRFKAVVINGMLTLGAILAVILATTLDLKDLNNVRMAILIVLAAISTLYLIFRWVRPRRR